MIFCDASALIAIIVGETGAERLADALEHDAVRLCPALSVWETMAGQCRSHAFSPAEARAHIARHLDLADIHFVAIGEAEYPIAADAYEKFGRGRRPAALNMGDRHAYACAKSHGACLLLEGNDFAKTDIEPA
jgi:ribonuclease VapC